MELKCSCCNFNGKSTAHKECTLQNKQPSPNLYGKPFRSHRTPLCKQNQNTVTVPGFHNSPIMYFQQKSTLTLLTDGRCELWAASDI
jgi:hypothetical protein